jgi:type IV pilus assembly protein PilW
MQISTSSRARSGNSIMRRLAGFSLIELMVAITLGLLLTGGLIQLFTSTKVTFRTNDALARVQENGRFTLEVLKRELREAGTNGFCAAQLDATSHVGSADALDEILEPGRLIIGWDFTNTASGNTFPMPEDLSFPGAGSWSGTDVGTLPGAITGSANPPVPGSDILITRRQRAIPGVTADSTGSDIELNTNHGLDGNPVALVTDCATGADVFQVTTGSGSDRFPLPGSGASPGNNAGSWSTTYDESMQAFEIEIKAYYVGLSTRGEPALFEAELSRDQGSVVPRELVGGVENMQIQYGFSRNPPDGDGAHVDDWLSANQVPSDGWPQVISMRMGFVMRSEETADTNSVAQTFNLADVNIDTQGDGRMRHAFSTTIALRNRLITI